MSEIQSEEKYQSSLKWLVEKSVKLADPLFRGEERNKLQRTYDYVTAQVLDYKRREREGNGKD